MKHPVVHKVFLNKFPPWQEIAVLLMARNMEQPAWVPKFTKMGFVKTRTPPDVHAMLLWEFDRNKSFLREEPLDRGGIISKEEIIKTKNKSSLMKLKKVFKSQIRHS